MNVNLPNGNTISMSVYEYFFLLEDEDMDEFYQSCLADNAGVYINNPFSNIERGKLDIDDEEEEESTN